MIIYSCLAFVGFLAIPNLSRGATFVITNGQTVTTGQTLSSGQSGTINAGGTLQIGSGSTVAITVTGSATITNNGVINQAGTGRAIRDNTGNLTLIITNTGTIESHGNDTFQMNVAGSSVTLTNSGTIESLGTGGSNGQAIDWNALNSNVGSNTLNNQAGGVITAADSDSVRPGQNGVIYNDGTIKSSTIGDSGNDGIDAQSNNNITVVNGEDMAGNTGGAALIEGARHGITGGNTATLGGTVQLGDYTGTGSYTMSITNTLGGIIQGDNGSGINIDGFGIRGPGNTLITNELVTVTNHGSIIGDGVTADGDGIDVDGNVIVDNFGTIVSKNAVPDPGSTLEFSEGVTVGGGTITNEANATIEGQVAIGNTQAVGRGITLAGIDKDANDNQMPIQSIYTNSIVTNSGLIKGDSDSGIAVLGTTGGGYSVTITNNATGTIEGNNTGISQDSTITGTGPFAGQMSGESLNKGAIELDDTGNTYVVTDYGTIKQDNTSGGSAVAMHSSTSNVLNILGGSASVIGDVSGDTAADSTLTINPGTGNSFSYGYVISNFTVQINSDSTTGTVTFSGANTYSGGTTITAGTLALAGPNGSLLSTGTVHDNGTFDISGITNIGDSTSIGNLYGSGVVALGANNLTLNDTGLSFFRGTIQDGGIAGGTFGSITKEGSGVLILTGASTYTGGTVVDAGIIGVGNSHALGNGSVTLNGGRLNTEAETGFLPPLTINVGNNPGANYTQNGGTLLLEVTGNSTASTTQAQAGTGGNYDTLVSSGGAAILGGTVQLNFENPAFAVAGQRYQVISANTAVTTDPIAVTVTGTTNSFLTSITTYNDSFGGAFAQNSVVVTLLQPFTTFGQSLTANQSSVANGVDNAVKGMLTGGVLMNPTGAQADFFNNIVGGLTTAANGGSLGYALDQLSPQRFQLLRNVAYDNNAFDVQTLDDEFSRERNGPGGFDTSGFAFNDSRLGGQLSGVKSRLLAWSPQTEPGLLSDSNQSVLGGVAMADSKNVTTPMGEYSKWNGFLDGGADLGSIDSNSDISNASYTTARIRVGGDYAVTSNLRVGMMFGYSHTNADLDNEGSKAKVNSYTPGIFVTYADKSGFYANGIFTGTVNDYSTSRNIIIPGVNRTASGSTSGLQFGADLDGGYEFHKGDWTFGPSAGLTYVNLGIDSFTEGGANSADLAINNQSSDSLRSRLGGSVSYKAKIGSVNLTPHVDAYWQHEFLDQSGSISSNFVGVPNGNFSVTTTQGDKNNALVGAGLDADLDQHVTLFIDYQAEAGGASYFGQSIDGGVKIGF